MTIANNGEVKVVKTKANGKAKAKWRNQSGLHAVKIVECVDFAKEVDCK